MLDSTVSVIIPVLNGGSWLREAVESCLNQSWPEVEVIVVDNGSTDGSLEVARAIGAENLLVTSCSTPGASAARNLGIDSCRGDYIQFLDADDVLHRDKIANQMRRLAHKPQGSVASGAWARFEHTLAEATFLREPVWRDLSPVDFLVTSWLGGGMIPVFAWLTPRLVVDEAGPWDESLSLNDDGEYFTRIVLAGAGVVFCEGAKGYYRTAPLITLSQRRDRQAAESALRSASLSCRRLLRTESSVAAYRACATAMKRVAYSTYPEHPDISAQAGRMARSFGGSDLQFGGGATTKLAVALFGWRIACRLQRWRRRLRGER